MENVLDLEHALGHAYEICCLGVDRSQDSCQVPNLGLVKPSMATNVAKCHFLFSKGGRRGWEKMSQDPVPARLIAKVPNYFSESAVQLTKRLPKMAPDRAHWELAAFPKERSF